MKYDLLSNPRTDRLSIGFDESSTSSKQLYVVPVEILYTVGQKCYFRSKNKGPFKYPVMKVMCEWWSRLIFNICKMKAQRLANNYMLSQLKYIAQ